VRHHRLCDQNSAWAMEKVSKARDPFGTGIGRVGRAGSGSNNIGDVSTRKLGS